MNYFLNLFDNTIENSRSLSTLYINLRDTVGIEDCYNNNLLKAQLVNVVSAFDMFIHSIVKRGIIEIFNKTRKETPKFQSFAFQAKTILRLLEVTTPNFVPSTPEDIPEIILEKELSNKLSFMSFQSPDKVVDALSLIWSEPHKMQVLAEVLTLEGATVNEKAITLRQKLSTIIERRNKIVHEGDIDPLSQTPRSIEFQDVSDATNFMQSLAHAIYAKVTDAECFKA